MYSIAPESLLDGGRAPSWLFRFFAVFQENVDLNLTIDTEKLMMLAFHRNCGRELQGWKILS
jgi:hypothetical protein